MLHPRTTSLADNTAKSVLAGDILFVLAMAASRLSVSVLLLRLSSSKKLVQTAKLFTVVIAVWGVAATIAVGVCSHIADIWTEGSANRDQLVSDQRLIRPDADSDDIRSPMFGSALELPASCSRSCCCCFLHFSSGTCKCLLDRSGQLQLGSCVVYRKSSSLRPTTTLTPAETLAIAGKVKPAKMFLMNP